MATSYSLQRTRFACHSFPTFILILLLVLNHFIGGITVIYCDSKCNKVIVAQCIVSFFHFCTLSLNLFLNLPNGRSLCTNER